MRSLTRTALLAASATAAAIGAWLAGRRSEETAAASAQAVATGGKLQVRLTGYWPFSAAASEKKMEGGVNDRRGRPLHTLEQHQAGEAPYVSVSGDDAIFPYGQRLSIDAWPGLTFRVVDTGGHFRGAGKVTRAWGREPLDICVESSKSHVPKEATATIAKGDHFDKAGKEVAVSKFQGQQVALGWCPSLECLGAKEF